MKVQTASLSEEGKLELRLPRQLESNQGEGDEENILGKGDCTSKVL